MNNALFQHRGQIAQMAAALGVSRKSLWERIRRYWIAGEDAANG
ncbi:helix-turn-helix domain-containing protein [Paraburkholderia caledonica]